MDDIQEIAEVCERAARAGGAVLLDWAQRFTVREKGPADLVTEADLAAENVVRRTIAKAFPHHRFIGEESTPTEQVEGILNDPSSCVWVVDPLDGTTNYAHHIPHYACSVAAVRGGQILAGVIFQPVAEECYIAIRGKGATLNGDRLRTSSVSELGSALVAVSIPPQIQRDAAEVHVRAPRVGRARERRQHHQVRRQLHAVEFVRGILCLALADLVEGVVRLVDVPLVHSWLRVARRLAVAAVEQVEGER